jgi:hypothetical protein
VDAGADVIQFDEPCFNIYLDEVVAWGIETLEQAMDGIGAQKAAHLLRLRNSDRAGGIRQYRLGHYGVTLPLLAEPRRSGVGGVRGLGDMAVLGELRERTSSGRRRCGRTSRRRKWWRRAFAALPPWRRNI